jgi:hypothetical protein
VKSLRFEVVIPRTPAFKATANNRLSRPNLRNTYTFEVAETMVERRRKPTLAVALHHQSQFWRCRSVVTMTASRRMVAEKPFREHGVKGVPVKMVPARRRFTFPHRPQASVHDQATSRQAA